MSFNNETEEQKQRDLEIESILKETHYLTDQEEMEKTAQKYRVKPKMAEIFSNASKQPRLENSNPLDVDKEIYDNTIEGEKTAATMQASLILDGSDDEKVLTPQQADAQLLAEKQKQEEEQKQENEEEDEIITLTPEYSEETTFSNEVLDDVEQFSEQESKIESIHGIDIEIGDGEPEQKPEEKAQAENAAGRSDEILILKQPAESKPVRKVVSKVPVYRTYSDENVINVKAGKFSEVVAEEYEQYIRSKNPSVITHVIKPEEKDVYEKVEEETKDNRPTSEKIISSLVGFFSNDQSDDNDTPVEETKIVDDYKGEDDEKSIMQEINHNIKKLFGRSVLSGGIALFTIIICVLVRIFPEQICQAVPFAPAAYAVLNLLIIGFSIFVNRVSVLTGLTPLVNFRGNSDTAVAIASVAAVVQAVVSFFCLGDIKQFDINYYTVVVLVAFFANNLGKLFMVLRVKANFRFVSADGQRYAAKIYNNEAVAIQMMSGTAVERPIIAYQHRTGFPSNFLKISYAPDPSEDLSSKMAPVTVLVSFMISVIYGIAFGSLSGAVNSFALLTAVCVPVVTLLAVNIPMYNLSKKLLSSGAMLSGYPSIKQFCDSTALMIDSNELFPADCVFLDGIKTFEDYNVDESLMCGIAILNEAQHPIAKVFDSVVAGTSGKLPEVESVLYEEEMGLVGWINGERILVGNRELMSKYMVETPSIEYEENYINDGKQVTYVARAGRLIAMFVTHYIADSLLVPELHRAEANGISILVRTSDCNITGDMICNLYKIFYRSVKVLPTGLGTVLKESQSVFEETSRAYLITTGKIASLARAVSGSVQIKRNISLSIVLQLVAVVMGILLSSTLSLYAGVGVMGTLEVLIYSVFWGAATLIAPIVHKS
ncbi:MAG: hypothetical protein UH080_04250 [Ruminococcus sp.]|nr:hypothetical protein [Ruminococcus sp.]